MCRGASWRHAASCRPACPCRAHAHDTLFPFHPANHPASLAVASPACFFVRCSRLGTPCQSLDRLPSRHASCRAASAVLSVLGHAGTAPRWQSWMPSWMPSGSTRRAGRSCGSCGTAQGEPPSHAAVDPSPTGSDFASQGAWTARRGMIAHFLARARRRRVLPLSLPAVVRRADSASTVRKPGSRLCLPLVQQQAAGQVQDCRG